MMPVLILEAIPVKCEEGETLIYIASKYRGQYL
jgi:hypothetical protein